MIAIGPFWIITIATYVVTFLIFFTLVLIQNKTSKQFNILQYFPQEILSNKDRLTPAIKVAMYAFVIPSALPIFLVGLNFQAFGSVAYIEIVIASILLLLSLLNIIITAIPVQNTKPHIIISTIYMTVTLLLCGLTGFNGAGFFYVYQTINMGSIPHLIFGILATLLTIAMIFIMFNPKLNKWYQLETHTEDDGTLVTSRPKVFPLAFSEWLSMLIAFTAGIFFILELIRY